MPSPIEFAFDYASPWSFLANATLTRHFGATPIAYIPVYLRGFDSFSQGVPYSAAKLAYLMKDFSRSARHAGVPIKMPTTFPINGLYALRAAVAAQREGAFPRLHEALFRAAWQESVNVSDKAVVIAIARDAGAHVADAIDEPEIKKTLRTSTDRVVARGAFGVPTFFVGDEMFWGHDRMNLAAEAAAG